MAETEAGRAASGVADQAKSAVRNLANNQKGRVADHIGGVAQALQRTAKNMEEHDSTSTIGRYAAQVAQQVDRLSQTLKEREVDDLWAETESFARRQPLLFIGGAMAAGFVLARLIKTGDRGAVRQTAGDLAEEARGTARDAGEAVGDAGQRLARRAAEATSETADEVASQVQH